MCEKQKEEGPNDLRGAIGIAGQDEDGQADVDEAEEGEEDGRHHGHDALLAALPAIILKRNPGTQEEEKQTAQLAEQRGEGLKFRGP